MPRRFFVLGGGTARRLVADYTLDAECAGMLTGRSLITCWAPAAVRRNAHRAAAGGSTVPPPAEAADFLSSRLKAEAGQLDALIWDLDDELLGVQDTGTGFPSPARDEPGVMDGRPIPVGSFRHLRLWKSAARRFVRFLKDNGLGNKTYVLPPVGTDSGEVMSQGAVLEPYFRYLRRLGVRVLQVPRTPVAVPADSRDAVFHRLAGALAGAMGVPAGEWNRDDRHAAPILCWTDVRQIQASLPGRTEHLVVPRQHLGERYPLRFLVQNSGSDTLIVISHGALSRSKYSLPRFEWLATVESRSENLLFLSDPVLDANPDVEVAWFTGDARDDVTVRLAAVVRAVADQLGARRILFAGGSGGGFASMALAALTPGSRALAFNPQTSIRKYWQTAVSTYQQALFPELGSPAGLAALGARGDAVERARRDPPVDYQVLYVQNSDDEFHMRAHLAPFAEVLQLPAQTARTADGNVQLVVERFADGHNMPYRLVLNGFLDHALRDWNGPLPAWDEAARITLVPAG